MPSCECGREVVVVGRAMERVAQALMHALARGLGLPERHFDATFAGGIGNTELQLQAVQELRPHGYIGTPSFLKIG